MLKISFRISFLLLLLLISFRSAALKPAGVDLRNHPPRIIRTCCMFGSRVGVVMVPFLRLSAITSTAAMGDHSFLGGSGEKNGVVYTRRGGFIDMGHLRDQADWTAYLFSLLEEEQPRGFLTRNLGFEGGEKSLQVIIPADYGPEELLHLAGRMAYDLSVWHEIATWFGVSSVPLVPEQYSSFSPEDVYSNLLGVFLGMEAVSSDLPYDEAMTLLVRQKMEELEAVDSEDATASAMESVRDLWWTRVRRYPSSKVVMLRHPSPYDPVCPYLIPAAPGDTLFGDPVCLPAVSSLCCSADTLYELAIRLNHKLPFQSLFPGRGERRITQRDFDTLVTQIRKEYETGFLVPGRIRDDNSAGDSPQRKGRKKKSKAEKKRI